uniref:Uncharacterized protein n=1 Tax=Timema douglasi TaxID=61478 RepID=A0A7R8Z613_TIMDO|nr:unnamed protein product [Timema douglasi]
MSLDRSQARVCCSEASESCDGVRSAYRPSEQVGNSQTVGSTLFSTLKGGRVAPAPPPPPPRCHLVVSGPGSVSPHLSLSGQMRNWSVLDQNLRAATQRLTRTRYIGHVPSSGLLHIFPLIRYVRVSAYASWMRSRQVDSSVPVLRKPNDRTRNSSIRPWKPVGSRGGRGAYLFRFSHGPQDHLDRLHTLAPSVDPAQISHLLSCCYALLSQESTSLGLPDFPADNLETAVAILVSETCAIILFLKLIGSLPFRQFNVQDQERFPSLPPYEVLYRLYPYKCFVGREGKQAVEDILNTFNITGDRKPAVALQQITLPQGQYSGQAQLSVNGQQSDVKVNNKLGTHFGGHVLKSVSLTIDWTADDGEIGV